MTGMCVRMTPVTVREAVRILLTPHPVTTASTVTVPTPAAAGPVPCTQEAPAPRRSATPARRQRTAALILQARPVPMTVMCVRMTPVTVREPVHILLTPHPVTTASTVTVLTPAAAGPVPCMREDPCPGTECNTCQEATDSCFDLSGTVCTDDGNVCTDDTCDGAGACAHPANTAPCDDGLYCTQIDECQGGLCIGRDDPCLDNGDYCDGVEYCQEDVADFICNSTGDPCDVTLTCNEAADVCDVSDVTVIVADASGYAGTIDITLDNTLDFVGEVHLDVCDRDQRPWLTISTASCSTTTRSSDFSCAVTDSGGGCVRVDLTTAVSGLIFPGTGAIARLTYTIDASTVPGDFADLTPENSDIRDETAASLTVTPKAGRVGALECVDDFDCGICEKCELASNLCVFQTTAEDVKGECASGLCSSGLCNGSGRCAYSPGTI